MHRALWSLTLFILLGFLGFFMGCGPNPPFAPFGSTIAFEEELGDVDIPPGTVIVETVRAQVLDPDGFPLNDVIVEFDLTFAGEDDLLIDTDGDGIPDAPAIQLLTEDDVPVVSPFETTTDNRGVATVKIRMTGDVVIDPTTFTASLENGTAASFEFSVNAGGG